MSFHRRFFSRFQTLVNMKYRRDAIIPAVASQSLLGAVPGRGEPPDDPVTTVRPVFAGVESVIRHLSAPLCAYTRKEYVTYHRRVIEDIVRIFHYAQAVNINLQRTPNPRQGKLTQRSASVNEIITTRGHQRCHRANALALLGLHLFPGYDSISRRGSNRVWVSFRAVYFRLRQVSLQRANPLVTSRRWAFPPRALASRKIVPRQKAYPLNYLVANCSCT
jgi:hypothetical protein